MSIITFGEAMIRLAPPSFQRIEQARQFEVEIGGAELNTAVGLVRLGHQVEWVSRLPDNPLGRLILHRVQEAGVGTRFVQLVPDGRCGLYFLEFGAAPRSSSILYDRQQSSLALAKPEHFDWPKIFNGAKWFHTTGITPALSPGAAATVQAALQAAQANGLATSIDLNYRSKLWSIDHARAVLSGLVHGLTVLFASEEDARLLFQLEGDFRELAALMCERFQIEHVLGTKRETPLVWRNRFGTVAYSTGQFLESPWYDVEIVDRLGTGDAMAAGVIHGLMHNDLHQAVAYGAAMGALKHTVPGDLPWIRREEVEAVLAGHGLRIQR